MSENIIVVDDWDRGFPGCMSFVDYLQGSGKNLRPGTRILFRQPAGAGDRLRHDAALIALARGHRPFPSLNDLVQNGAPTFADRFSAFQLKEGHVSRSAAPVVGVLHDPGDDFSPSGLASLECLGQQFARRGVLTKIIDPRDDASLTSLDALFIRTHTNPGGLAWRWSVAARDLGLPVIDDPDSILRCCNKLFMMESFRIKGIPAPRGLLMTCDEDIDGAIDSLGLPLILKIPDSSYSRGVFKADSVGAARAIFQANRSAYPILLAQEFVPTEFDWRIGVLDGTPLYACRYFMTRDHWQILKLETDGSLQEGLGDAIAVRNAPRDLLAVAVKAANCMGQGLYGVDLKIVAGTPLVIEVNDNPTIESDLEASIDPVWTRLADSFASAIERQRQSQHEVVERRAVA